jgi:hypothetical protein
VCIVIMQVNKNQKVIKCIQANGKMEDEDEEGIY